MREFFEASYWEQYGLKDYDTLNEYFDLVKRSLGKTRDDYDYSEKHYIVPESLNYDLSDDPENMVILSGRDHFIAHRMLSKCLSGKFKRKMTMAFHMMCYNKNADHYNATPEDYELSRSQMSETFSGENNPAKRPEVKAKIAKGGENRCGKNNGNYGGLSEENKKHLSESRILNGTAKGERNPMYGKRGEKSPHYGKKHMHIGSKDITVPKDKISEYEAIGWILGRPTKAEKSNSSSTIENTNQEEIS